MPQKVCNHDIFSHRDTQIGACNLWVATWAELRNP